jgi:hypothetical protein
MQQLQSGQFSDTLALSGVYGNALVFVKRGGPGDDMFERMLYTVPAHFAPAQLAVMSTRICPDLNEKFRTRSSQSLDSLGPVLLFYQNGEPRGRMNVYQSNGQMATEQLVIDFISKYIGPPPPSYSSKYKSAIANNSRLKSPAGEPAIYSNEVENYFMQTQYGTQPPVHAPPSWSLRMKHM